MKIKREGKDNFNLFRTLVLVGIKAKEGAREGGMVEGKEEKRERQREGKRVQEPESVNNCSISAVGIALL